MTSCRQEYDALGPVAVEAQRLWGAQTQRALAHFRISHERMPVALIHALASVKQACAVVNGELGLLPAQQVQAIVRACQEVMTGKLDEEFPLVVWQTGSGTQTNMNVNEVLANRASELLGGGRGEKRLLHPNDQVNLGQSSNDVFPSAVHLAAAVAMKTELLPALQGLRASLAAHAQSFAGIVKLGRTHLQDATPLTLGQEFSGYEAQLAQAGAMLSDAMAWLYPLAIGGTAVGTGLNTHPQFGARVAADLARRHQMPLTSASNKFAALAGHEPLVAVHGALRTLAVALTKIANDIRWLASGPRSGLGEIHLPENEPGSSIMPGKVNPTQCEALTMLCAQVMGNDVALGIGAASGHFELDVYKPLIAHNLLQSIRLLADGMRSFDRYAIQGIAPDLLRIEEHLNRSLMLVTALVPHIGYDRSASIARQAFESGSSLREAALSLGYVTAQELDHWLQPASMLGPRKSESNGSGTS